METKKRDTSKKRNTILDAAVQGFREEGYYNCSMDKIAEIAGASKRTVYNHFPSKELLFKAVLGRYLEGQNEIPPVPYDSDRPLKDQLSDFADTEIYLIATPDRRGLAKVLTSIFMYNPQMAFEAKAEHSSSRERFVQWITKAKEDGRLKINHPADAAALFYGMVEGCLTWPALFQENPDFSAIETMKQEVIETFLERHRL